MMRIIKIIILFVTTSVLAQHWEPTELDQKFKSIYARNGMLVGIKANNFPCKWERPKWKQLGDQEFLSLTTNGTTIAGVMRRDQNAYVLNGTTWQSLEPFIFLTFDYVVFSKNKLIGIAIQPLPRVFIWDSPSWKGVGSKWKNIGNQKFTSVDADGEIICGLQQSDSPYENKSLNNLVYTWQKDNWENIRSQQFQQIITNGTIIYGIGQSPKSHVFEFSDKYLNQLGTEKFTQIAANANILCGIQEKNQLILLWIGKKWIALDTKKFTQVATDGKTIYGLANDKKVYYWTNNSG